MNERPYDDARLEVVVGAALPGLPVLDLGGEAGPYLIAHGLTVRPFDPGEHPLPLADGSAGGAVALWSLSPGRRL